MWNTSWICPQVLPCDSICTQSAFFSFSCEVVQNVFSLIQTSVMLTLFGKKKIPLLTASTDIFLIENMQSSSYLNWSQRKLCFPFPCLCIWCVPSFITSWIIDAFPVLIWQLGFLRWLWTSYGVLHPEVSLSPSLNRKYQEGCSLHPQTEGVCVSACIFQLY